LLLKHKEILRKFTFSLSKRSTNSKKTNLNIQKRPIFKYFNLKSKSKHVMSTYFSKSVKANQSTSIYDSSNQSSVFGRRDQKSSTLTSSSRVALNQRLPFLYFNLQSKSRLAKQSFSKLNF
jgi:hypothetical protein